MQRSRNILFTVSNPTDVDVKKCKDIILLFPNTFICLCYEKTTMKVFIHFKNPIRFNSITKVIPTAKYVKPKKDPFVNYSWCIKNCPLHSIWTQGIIPKNGVQTTSKLVEVAIKEGRSPEFLEEKFPMWYIMHGKKYEDSLKRKEIRKSKNINTCNKIVAIIPKDFQYKIARQCDSVYFNGPDGLDTYLGEHCIIAYANMVSIDIEAWINGFPKKIRRGYEILCCNPNVVYICYANFREFDTIQSIYEEFISMENSIYPYQVKNVKYEIKNNILFHIIEKEYQDLDINDLEVINDDYGIKEIPKKNVIINNDNNDHIENIKKLQVRINESKNRLDKILNEKLINEKINFLTSDDNHECDKCSYDKRIQKGLIKFAIIDNLPFYSCKEHMNRFFTIFGTRFINMLPLIVDHVTEIDNLINESKRNGLKLNDTTYEKYCKRAINANNANDFKQIMEIHNEEIKRKEKLEKEIDSLEILFLQKNIKKITKINTTEYIIDVDTIEFLDDDVRINSNSKFIPQGEPTKDEELQYINAKDIISSFK